jgi:hypothetical protein
VEKAERNVLPLLNNLMENREIMLEDGRFLAQPGREALAAQEGGEEVEVVPVSPNFRVIAIAQPTPLYPGYPLELGVIPVIFFFFWGGGYFVRFCVGYAGRS